MLKRLKTKIFTVGKNIVKTALLESSVLQKQVISQCPPPFYTAIPVYDVEKKTIIENYFIENEIYFEDERIFSADNLKNITLNIKGTGNKVYLNQLNGKGQLCVSFENVSDNTFIFGKNNTINNTLYAIYYNAPGKTPKGVKIEIGSNNVFNGTVHVLSPLCNGNSVSIADNNLFANNIMIKGMTDHLIYDINTFEQINREFGLKIGNHNWFCDDCLILNKSEIASDCVIAARSVVNKAFTQSNVLIAGTPAIIKKTDIGWHISLDDSYKEVDSIIK